jgi:hypothetical protein
MRFPTMRSLAVLVMACVPVLAHAEMYKCVGPNGTSIFSDRPCDSQRGEKAAEIKDDAAFAAALARDNASNTAQSCMELQHRLVNCRAGIDSMLASKLREHCRSPVMRFQQSLRQSNREQDQYQDEREMGPQESRCEALQPEAFSFVKANFAKNISEQDMKTIEYNMAAVPSDGRIPDLKIRRRNRQP